MHHPSPARKPSPMREVEKRVEEAEKQVEEARWLEEVGQLPSSLPTQQLAQMAAEARPSISGEEQVKRNLHPTVGGKAPQKEFLKAGKVKKTRKYQPGKAPKKEFLKAGKVKKTRKYQPGTVAL